MQSISHDQNKKMLNFFANVRQDGGGGGEDFWAKKISAENLGPVSQRFAINRKFP